MPHRVLEIQVQRGPGDEGHRHLEPGLWPPTWPMGLTMLRLLLLPVFLWFLLVGSRHAPSAGVKGSGYRWWALGIFAVMALTDKLDGYLARRLNQTSKLGTLLDPLADKLLIACSVILLSFDWVAPPGYAIPIWVVIAVYAKDVVVAVGTLALLSLIGKVAVHARPLGKLSTVLQLGVVIATLAAPDVAKISEPLARELVRILWWLVSVVAAASCGDYVMTGVRQYRAGISRQSAVVSGQ